MFLGEFQSPLGEKNRVALPKKLREQMQTGQVVLTRGYERCLIIVDEQHWTNLVSEINKRALLELNVRDTKRFLLGGAHELITDSQGRFVIPEGLLSYAEIKEQVAFIGVGEWIEIWDLKRWEEKLAYLAEHSADIADRLSETHA